MPDLSTRGHLSPPQALNPLQMTARRRRPSGPQRHRAADQGPCPQKGTGRGHRQDSTAPNGAPGVQ
eukprot:scaffold2948_cov296-Prasinococcus_capsulatus_cf.AAC.2